MKLQAHEYDYVVMAALCVGATICMAVHVATMNHWLAIPMLMQGFAAGYLKRNAELVREGKIIMVDPSKRSR